MSWFGDPAALPCNLCAGQNCRKCVMGLALASPERIKPQNPDLKGAQAARSAGGAQCACSWGRSRGLDAALPPYEQGVIPLKLMGLEFQNLNQFRVWQEGPGPSLLTPMHIPSNQKPLIPCKCPGDINFTFNYL